jgi:hypothetical protein
VVWHSRASLSILNNRNDLVGLINEAHMAYLRGLATGIRIEGLGQVVWTFLDCQGTFWMLTLPAYFVPLAGMRLLSTSSLLQEYPSDFEIIHANKHGLQLSGTFGSPEAGKQATNGVQVLLDPPTNLPVAYTLDPDGSRCPSGFRSASNRRHGDSNSPSGGSAGSNGA